MDRPSDLAIARAARLRPLRDVAADMGIPPALMEPRGEGVAKLSLATIDALQGAPLAKYVVVSAITPTPLGEGKTATAIGLAQGLARLGKRATVTLRQPSMGPTFGTKGGAAGGGYSQVVPMEAMNLHLTGDFHAVTAAHNLLAALVDNHLYHGNALGLYPPTISWPRVGDVDDRALRSIVVGLGGALDGVPRQTGFHITAASEVMAVLGLAVSLRDLRARLGRIVVGARRDGSLVTAEDVRGAGAMAVLLRDALSPNLLQTLEGTPVLVHTGPFGNIAHGNSSVVADLVGIRTADVLLTEAGFGADLGAERFFHIKCRASGLAPDAAVLVASVRALKAHSGRHEVVAGRQLPASLAAESPDDVLAGAANLLRQIENLRVFGVPVVVAVNVFPGDHSSELRAIEALATDAGVRAARCTAVADGGPGAEALAAALVDALSEPARFRPLYLEEQSLAQKITTIATRIYGAAGVAIEPAAARQLAAAEANGFGRCGVCIAKTHLSLTDDPHRPGAPRDWTLPVRDVRLAAGAGFVVARCGDISLMPGLGSDPAAHHIDLDAAGQIVGLS